jgi:hypothetical protein
MKAARVKITLSIEMYVDDAYFPIDPLCGETTAACRRALAKFSDAAFGLNTMSDFDTVEWQVAEVEE